MQSIFNFAKFLFAILPAFFVYLPSGVMAADLLAVPILPLPIPVPLAVGTILI